MRGEILTGYTSQVSVITIHMEKKEMAKTIQVSVRIPKTTYEMVKQQAGGTRAFGAFINQAIQAYTNQPVTIARAVIEALREAGALQSQ